MGDLGNSEGVRKGFTMTRSSESQENVVKAEPTDKIASLVVSVSFLPSFEKCGKGVEEQRISPTTSRACLDLVYDLNGWNRQIRLIYSGEYF